MIPFVSSGRFGKKDATITTTIVSTSIIPGTGDVISVRSPASTGSFISRNRNSMIGIVANAPSSTAKKIPGLPFIKKKSVKVILA